MTIRDRGPQLQFLRTVRVAQPARFAFSWVVGIQVGVLMTMIGTALALFRH